MQFNLLIWNQEVIFRCINDLAAMKPTLDWYNNTGDDLSMQPCFEYKYKYLLNSTAVKHNIISTCTFKYNYKQHILLQKGDVSVLDGIM